MPVSWANRFAAFFLLHLVIPTGGWGLNLLANSSFDAGFDGWSVYAPTGKVDLVREERDQSVRIVVAATEEIGHPHVYQRFPVSAGDILEGTALIRTLSASGGKGPYLSFSFYGENPERLSFTQSESTHDLGEWTEVNLLSVVPEKAVEAGFALILHGRGEAEFASAGVRRLESRHRMVDAEAVSLTFRPEDSFPLFGFGVEDDGWFFNADNLGTGFTEEEVKVREDRIRDLDPDLVRMFFWCKDWNPSGDWKTFDFDNDNMRSHYRTLDLYQSLGARVGVVGVEWGVKHPFPDAEAVGAGYAELLHHLIRERGYNCIRDWTLSNEPNHLFPRLGYTFEDFRDIHLAASREFDKRALAVSLIGSDDAQDFLWFSKCLEDPNYLAAVDALASHRYFKGPDRILASRFFEERIEAIRSSGKDLPLILAEFGFQDERSGTFENPVMKTFEYALWTARLAIEGLNQGVAGYSLWCLHEVVYPGGSKMTYGLWDDHENDWRLRPVYFAWRNFCRLTEPGDTVIPCRVEPRGGVDAARVGDVLFWVNEGKTGTTLSVIDAAIEEGRFWNRESVEANDHEGGILDCEIAPIRLPSNSFGWIRFKGD